MSAERAELERELRMAARALARHGLAHAYGHVSVRLPATARHGSGGRLLVCAPRPMGLLRPGEPGTEVAIDGELPEGVLGEVRIHQAIYRRRPEVGAICRFQSPAVIGLSALGVTPRILHGLGAYFRPSVPLHGDPGLCRDQARADAVAGTLGAGRAVVMRGNGAVTAGDALPQALAYAFFLEDAARIDLAVRQAGGDARPYTPEEAADRDLAAGGLFSRMWDYLTAGDPESST